MINRISDFESGMSSLQRQSLISLSGIESVSKPYSFWKWGALILAVLASFGAIIRRVKILIIKFQSDAASLQEPLLRALDGNDSLDETCSLSPSSSECCDNDAQEEIGDRELIGGSSVGDRRTTDEIFQVKGTGVDFLDHPWQLRGTAGLQRRRSVGDHLSEFASGRSVVKLWDNLGLGLGLELDGDDLISWNHPNRSRNTYSSSSASPAVIVNKTSASSLGFWDTREASRRPAILAEWGPQIGSANSIGRVGIHKVYLSGGGGGQLAAVGDLRKVSTPLDNVTEADVETWWDADAVVVNDEFVVGGSAWNGHSSAMSGRCDSVRSYLS